MRLAGTGRSCQTTQDFSSHPMVGGGTEDYAQELQSGVCPARTGLVAKKKSGQPRSRGKGEGKGGRSRPSRSEVKAESVASAGAPRDPTHPAPKPEVVVVGIGASAGGLNALREFFRN